MKAPRIIKSVEIVANFEAIFHFGDGSIRLVDFKKAPLEGAFMRVQTDLVFFNTMHVRNGYVIWQGGLTIDSDFLHEHGK